MSVFPVCSNRVISLRVGVHGGAPAGYGHAHGCAARQLGAGRVAVMVVRIVEMAMLMHHDLVSVVVFVALGKVQPR